MDLKAYLEEKRLVVEEALKGVFAEPEGPEADLLASMNYSLLSGGKRLRPILCMAGAEAVGGEGRDALPVACALELIHTYSLIHDDLPVMDNDDLRRGRPTNHKIFGDAVALLAGDGLLTEAFRLISGSHVTGKANPQVLLEVIGLIAEAAGYRGMIGGQVVDVQSAGKAVQPPLVAFIHAHKTGALITAAVSSGAMLGGGEEAQIGAITRYGENIGLAFQIADDLLDIEGDSEHLGKPVGGDARKKKITYPSVIGLKEAKQTQREMVEEAIHALKGFDEKADPLREIAVYIIERKK